jgi:PR domain zinc finger protein 8
MRSHHKHEAADPLRRKREEKLKCPVCSESFRERHHLTRHMTAHQDKAGDHVDSELLISTAANQIGGK